MLLLLPWPSVCLLPYWNQEQAMIKTFQLILTKLGTYLVFINNQELFKYTRPYVKGQGHLVILFYIVRENWLSINSSSMSLRHLSSLKPTTLWSPGYFFISQLKLYFSRKILYHNVYIIIHYIKKTFYLTGKATAWKPKKWTAWKYSKWSPVSAGSWR